MAKFYDKYLEVKSKPKKLETQLKLLKEAKKKKKAGIFWYMGEHGYNTLTLTKMKDIEKKLKKNSFGNGRSRKRVARPAKKKALQRAKYVHHLNRPFAKKIIGEFMESDNPNDPDCNDIRHAILDLEEEPNIRGQYYDNQKDECYKQCNMNIDEDQQATAEAIKFFLTGTRGCREPALPNSKIRQKARRQRRRQFREEFEFSKKAPLKRAPPLKITPEKYRATKTIQRFWREMTGPVKNWVPKGGPPKKRPKKNAFGRKVYHSKQGAKYIRRKSKNTGRYYKQYI